MINSADDSEMDSERGQRTFIFRPAIEQIETRKNFFAFAADESTGLSGFDF